MEGIVEALKNEKTEWAEQQIKVSSKVEVPMCIIIKKYIVGVMLLMTQQSYYWLFFLPHMHTHITLLLADTE